MYPKIAILGVGISATFKSPPSRIEGLFPDLPERTK